jgi:hypothetical protein
MRPEGLRHSKTAVTPSEIKPATFRLVAQCLNQMRHQQRAPPVGQFWGMSLSQSVTVPTHATDTRVYRYIAMKCYVTLCNYLLMLQTTDWLWAFLLECRNTFFVASHEHGV